MDGVNKNIAIICGTIVVVCLILSIVVLVSPKSNTNQVTNNQQQGSVTIVSMDDDAVLGDKNAPVTLIEFSDYECPFCKRHFTDVYPQIKKDYIDTGKVKFVFRDFIAVPGHNPLATAEAMAAQCAKDQGGDDAYFKYHDEIFKKTTSNGNGLLMSDLAVIAKNVGLNSGQFKECLDSGKFDAEVKKDIADGYAAGVSGTPSFFVGLSTENGSIEGDIIVGAQPYSAFKTAIEALLNK